MSSQGSLGPANGSLFLTDNDFAQLIIFLVAQASLEISKNCHWVSQSVGHNFQFYPSHHIRTESHYYDVISAISIAIIRHSGLVIPVWCRATVLVTSPDLRLTCGIRHWDTSQGPRLEIFPLFLFLFNFVLINSRNCSCTVFSIYYLSMSVVDEPK